MRKRINFSLGADFLPSGKKDAHRKIYKLPFPEKQKKLR